MNRDRLRIGIAQMDSVLGDIPANVDRAAGYVRDAKARGVEMLVFPELVLSGYSIGSRFEQTAIRPDSPHVERLKALSREVPFVIGLIEETEDTHFYNSAIYFADGEVRHVHRKIYLPTYGIFEEGRYFGRGKTVRTFRTPWGRMAVLICGDCWHLSLPYLAAHDGASVLIILAASSNQGLVENISPRDAWERMNRSYALTLSNFVVFANRAGAEAGLQFWGGSNVIGPDGNVLAQARFDEPDLLVADVDFKTLRRQRIILPFRRDDNLDLTLDEGKRILHARFRRLEGFYSSRMPFQADSRNNPSAAQSTQAADPFSAPTTADPSPPTPAATEQRLTPEP